MAFGSNELGFSI